MDIKGLLRNSTFGLNILSQSGQKDKWDWDPKLSLGHEYYEDFVWSWQFNENGSKSNKMFWIREEILLGSSWNLWALLEAVSLSIQGYLIYLNSDSYFIHLN